MWHTCCNIESEINNGLLNNRWRKSLSPHYTQAMYNSKLILPALVLSALAFTACEKEPLETPIDANVRFNELPVSPDRAAETITEDGTKANVRFNKLPVSPDRAAETITEDGTKTNVRTNKLPVSPDRTAASMTEDGTKTNVRTNRLPAEPDRAAESIVD